MNVLAGIAIGWLIDGWTMKLAASAVWAVAFCAWQAVAAAIGIGQAPHYLAHARQRAAHGGPNATFAFVFPAYVSAVGTAFVVAAIVALIRLMF